MKNQLLEGLCSVDNPKSKYQNERRCHGVAIGAVGNFAGFDGGFDGFDGFDGYDGVRGFDGYDGGIDGFKPKQRRDNCKR